MLDRFSKARLLGRTGRAAERLIVPGPLEGDLANAFLSALPTDRRPDFDGVSREDEMYMHLCRKLPRPEFALQQYLADGLEAVQVIENVVGTAGKSMAELRSFLDFACGHGKSTRFLVKRTDPSRVWVSDIYADAVAFQRARFGVAGFNSAHDPGQVAFGRRFEVIYVGSLFSHLPEDAFRAWLATLYERLEDDGLLILSTQGASVQPLDDHSAATGFRFVEISESRSLDRRRYGSTTVTEAWVRRLAQALGIVQVAYLPRELWAQDLFVFAKTRVPQLDGLAPTPRPRGNIEAARLDMNGSLQVSGWAIDPSTRTSVAAVRLQLGREIIGEASLGCARPDVAAHFDDEAFGRSGWTFIGPIPAGPIAGPPQVLKVLLVSADGSETCLVEPITSP